MLTRTALVFAIVLTLTAAAMAVAPRAYAGGKPYGIKPPPKRSRYDVTTRFAVALVRRPVYRRPTTRSGMVKRLAFFTPDAQALQTYLLLGSRRVKVRLGSRRVKRTLWERIAVPMRPNGRTGWVKRSWLGPAKTSRTLIVVTRSTETMNVYRKGKLIFTAPVGTGNLANGTTTPPGHFWIAEAFPSSDPFYGPWAFGTTDYATDTEFPDGSIVGIHGTNEPWLIPGDPSHGCIRMKDPDILRLKTLASIGTAVWIQ